MLSPYSALYFLDKKEPQKINLGPPFEPHRDRAKVLSDPMLIRLCENVSKVFFRKKAPVIKKNWCDFDS